MDVAATLQWVRDHALMLGLTVAFLSLAAAIVNVLFGPGLVVRAWSRRRTRLRVLNFKEESQRDLMADLRDLGADLRPRLSFEIENLGADTSLEPSITLTGYTPKGVKRLFMWRVDSDRTMPSNRPVSMKATFQTEDIWGADLPRWRDDANLLGFLWFKTYTFTPTRGRRTRLQIRSADGVRLGRLRFWWELLWFRLRGEVQVPPQGTLPA